MITWLLKLIGISETFTGRLDEAHWMWARPRVFLAGLILLAPLAVFIVLRHRRSLPNVSSPLRGMLSVCRICVLALLVIVLGGPYLRLEEPVTQKPVLAWLTDESASMSLPVGACDDAQLVNLALAAGMLKKPDDDAPVKVEAEVRRELVNLSRTELAARVVHHQRADIIEPLAEEFELRRYRFARRVRRDTSDQTQDPQSTDASPADDRGDTALGDALDEVIALAAGRRLAGIVLLTDGRSTTGADPLQVMRRHQTVSAEKGAAPVWTIPVGSAEPLVDIALLDALAPAQLAVGDTAVVVATISSHGFDDRRVKVTLLEGDKALEEAEISLRAGERQQVQLDFEATAPGVRLLTVEVAPQGEEQVQDNNRSGLAINVDEQRWRVLYIEGYPNWDFRFLDHSLRRDHGLEVSVVMEASLNADVEKGQDLATVAKLPEDAAGFAQYNVVMLGDITPALLPPQRQRSLARAVRDEGLGLIVRAGPQAMPHAFAGGPLGALLPVRLERGDGLDESDSPGVEAPAFSPFQMAVTAAGSRHPAFRLYDSATRNRSVWSRMPPFFWAAAAAEASPGGTVLATLTTAGKERPLIVEHFAGAGRVLLVGTDATYRWRRNIGDHLFYRFWGQAIRRVARSKQRSIRKNWLEAYPARIAAGEGVSIELYAVDEGGEPLTDAEARVRVTRGDSTETVILERSAEPGRFRGTWNALEVGEYRLAYTDRRGAIVDAAVRVAKSGRELLRPDVDRDTLGALADLTAGGLIELDRLAELPQKLEGETITVTRTHEEEIWDNWLTLVVLVTLYCADVFVRRMSGLT